MEMVKISPLDQMKLVTIGPVTCYPWLHLSDGSGLLMLHRIAQILVINLSFIKINILAGSS